MFKYLICLDFEATCWEEENKESMLLAKKQEIIEFGAVLLNLSTGEIESEFHEFVKPTNHPILSTFCIDLTHISQELIDKQERFPAVYNKFIVWLQKIASTKELKFATPNEKTSSLKNTAFCTWSNWDLNHFFVWDCTIHNISRPTYLKAWIDGCRIFKETIGCHRNFTGALEKLNITCDNLHSAVHDAKNLSKIMYKLHCSGAKLDRITTWKL